MWLSLYALSLPSLSHICTFDFFRLLSGILFLKNLLHSNDKYKWQYPVSEISPWTSRLRCSQDSYIKIRLYPTVMYSPAVICFQTKEFHSQADQLFAWSPAACIREPSAIETRKQAAGMRLNPPRFRNLNKTRKFKNLLQNICRL
jgi:hypothetical protein